MTTSGREKIYKEAAKNPNCSPARVAAYQGIMQPYCHGGAGCVSCWDKWYVVRAGHVE